MGMQPSRRTFLKGTAAGMAVASMSGLAISAPANAASRRTVAVLGGGIAGLTAAHELAERGFAVTVYERRALVGGKITNPPVPGTGRGGRKDLPGDYVWRAYFGFCRDLSDVLLDVVQGLTGGFLQLPADEAAVFAQRLLVYMTSSESRRLAQWDSTTGSTSLARPESPRTINAFSSMSSPS
jgi:uncharacterized protein with NAD-binding domain and iron-sulfur cluster